MASETADAGARPHRRLHRMTFLFTALRIGRQVLLPAVISGVSAGGDDLSSAAAWTAAFVGVPALFFAVLRYRTFRFGLGAEELVVDSGVVSRRRRVIPFHRIQNIDLRQGTLERLFDVAELRVETAGGARTEAVLAVLGLEDARSLRAELLERRRASAVEEGEAAGEPELLARLSPGDLALAGATANEVGLIVAALAGLLGSLDELIIDRLGRSVDPSMLEATAQAWGLGAVVAVAAALLLAGWIFSIAGAVVGYWGFTLERSGDELRKRYGVLARGEGVVPLERVQAVRIEESLLRRPLGLASVKVETAGGRPGERQRGGAEAFLPIARATDLPRLVGAVFRDLDLEAVRLLPVHRLARRRLFVRAALPLTVAVAALSLADARALLLLALLAPLAWAAGAAYRHRGWAVGGGYVVTREGFFNRRTWIVPERKVQTLHVTQTPFQRRHALATLVVDTAGTRRAPRVADLGEAAARGIVLDLAERVG